MRHKFDKVEIPQGATSVQETCTCCGIIRTRFASGGYDYHGQRGPCTGQPEERPVKAPQKRGRKPKVIEASLLTDRGLPPDPVKKFSADDVLSQFKSYPGSILSAGNKPHPETAPRKTTPGLGITEPEARLKEALVIINVLYEDLVTHGVRTRGRGIAGAFLYSQGYAELAAKYEHP